jgi:hypothetical protein
VYERGSPLNSRIVQVLVSGLKWERPVKLIYICSPFLLFSGIYFVCVNTLLLSAHLHCFLTTVKPEDNPSKKLNKAIIASSLCYREGRRSTWLINNITNNSQMIDARSTGWVLQLHCLIIVLGCFVISSGLIPTCIPYSSIATSCMWLLPHPDCKGDDFCGCGCIVRSSVASPM